MYSIVAGIIENKSLAETLYDSKVWSMPCYAKPINHSIKTPISRSVGNRTICQNVWISTLFVRKKEVHDSFSLGVRLTPSVQCKKEVAFR